jgi:hypothetical protein
MPSRNESVNELVTIEPYAYSAYNAMAALTLEDTEPKPKKKKKKPKLQTGEQIMTRLLGNLQQGNRAVEVIKSVGVKKKEDGEYSDVLGIYRSLAQAEVRAQQSEYRETASALARRQIENMYLNQTRGR